MPKNKLYSEQEVLTLMQIGRKVRNYRELHCLNIQDMSKSCGLTVRRLDSIECGTAIPDDPSLEKIMVWIKKLITKD